MRCHSRCRGWPRFLIGVGQDREAGEHHIRMSQMTVWSFVDLHASISGPPMAVCIPSHRDQSQAAVRLTGTLLVSCSPLLPLWG